MTIRLDHTIVRAKDKADSAKFFAGIFGLTARLGQGPFAQVQVNEHLNCNNDCNSPVMAKQPKRQTKTGTATSKRGKFPRTRPQRNEPSSRWQSRVTVSLGSRLRATRRPINFLVLPFRVRAEDESLHRAGKPIRFQVPILGLLSINTQQR